MSSYSTRNDQDNPAAFNPFHSRLNYYVSAQLIGTDVDRFSSAKYIRNRLDMMDLHDINCASKEKAKNGDTRPWAVTAWWVTNVALQSYSRWPNSTDMTSSAFVKTIWTHQTKP